MSINKALLFSQMFILVPVVGSRICHPVAELTQFDRSHVAPTLKCLPPGPLQVKLVAFSLRGGFSTRNAPGNAPGNALGVPASFLRKLVGSPVLFCLSSA